MLDQQLILSDKKSFFIDKFFKKNKEFFKPYLELL